MTLDSSKMNGMVNFTITTGQGVELIVVLNEPLQPLTTSSDSSHPTGFFRDGYCWGSSQDPGSHFIGAVVTDQFLQYSKEKGVCALYSRREGIADDRKRPYDSTTWVCRVEGRM